MSDIHSQNAELLDQMFHDWLKNGRPVYNKKGKIVGRRALSAAEATAIIKRIASAKSGAAAGKSTFDLEAEAERRRAAGLLHFNGQPITHPVPPLDTETLEDRRA